jgi:hypothetical protein
LNRRRLLTTGALALTPISSRAASRLERFAPTTAGGRSFDHGAFEKLLQRYVKSADDGVNRVAYGAWRASRADVTGLESYLRQLQSESPGSLTAAEQFAYWANLYNAETIRIVLAAYPVKSILNIRPTLISIGPWKKPTLSVAGQGLSLDDVENGILRPLFRDVRVHYALNCASMSCPNLNTRPWRGTSLSRDLDAAAQAYVNHPRGARATWKGLILSNIYKWYRNDFGGSDANLLAHLRRYAHAPFAAKLGESVSIAGYDYDWNLNDASAQPA